MREFDLDKVPERADTFDARLRPILRQLFPLARAAGVVKDIAEQKQGIDIRVHMNHSPYVTLDFKFRSQIYEDFCLEFKHVYPGGREKIGWVADSTKAADYVAYVFKGSWWMCWLLPRARLTAAWQAHAESWCEQFGVTPTKNRDYVTLWTPVPIALICEKVGGVRMADATSTRAIVRFPEHPERYCFCGRDAHFGYPHGWFCQKHKAEGEHLLTEPPF